MKQIELTTNFAKNWKALRKKHYDYEKLNTVIELLATTTELPGKYKDHALYGNWQGYRECHIEANWLLIYQTTETKLILIATAHTTTFSNKV